MCVQLVSHRSTDSGSVGTFTVSVSSFPKGPLCDPPYQSCYLPSPIASLPSLHPLPGRPIASSSKPRISTTAAAGSSISSSWTRWARPTCLAHGLGDPVRDAVTVAKFPSPGRYRLWVRTRDWVAPWKAPAAPGRFQVLIDGKPLATTFGTEGAAWHWQDGGPVEVRREARVALHDLTGFEGRCDALLFCRDLQFSPPNGRRRVSQVPPQAAGPARRAIARR